MANYTQNYQLHQWEPQDPFLRTDFNQDLQKIDTALGGLANQSAALEAAVALCGNCKMEVVTFTGTGESPLTITFPQKPAYFFIVAGDVMIAADVLSEYATIFEFSSTTHSASLSSLSITWNGNTATFSLWQNILRSFNIAGKNYGVLTLLQTDTD